MAAVSAGPAAAAAGASIQRNLITGLSSNTLDEQWLTSIGLENYGSTGSPAAIFKAMGDQVATSCSLAPTPLTNEAEFTQLVVAAGRL